MSRQINLESVLSDDEMEYLRARGRDTDLARNAAFLIERGGDDTTGETSVPYEDLTKAELTDEINDRNAEEDSVTIEVHGSTKADLIAALEADDERRSNS